MTFTFSIFFKIQTENWADTHVEHKLVAIRTRLENGTATSAIPWLGPVEIFYDCPTGVGGGCIGLSEGLPLSGSTLFVD